MSGLGTSFGFGACTNFPRDLVNSDCILIMGSNMAESHPVGFQWVVEARQRGARVIHVDPRFTRTSAGADLAVRIRPATDLAFLGGVIRHILHARAWFSEYIVPYTNAATLLSERYTHCDATGLFAGFDPLTRRYDHEPDAWDYALDEQGQPLTDPTLEHPRCVLRVLERHFAEYTPEHVADVCGCAPDEVQSVAELLIANSGRERTAAIAYALGWTQHTTGPQIIRAAGIIQMLLGNMGRPGGGIIALRGHSNVQGATDIPTLFNSLPNYLPQPTADPVHADLRTFLAHGHGVGNRRGQAEHGLWEKERSQGAWAALPRYFISLLKAWYGDAATPDNDFGYGNLPKLEGDESEQSYFMEMLYGHLKGLFLFGQNPAVSSPNAAVHRNGLRKLDWLVVVDAFETESAAVWYADPDGPDPSLVETEVFLLPAALGPEKRGSVTNTERLVQWHEPVIPAPGACRSDLWYVYQLGLRLKQLYATSTRERDRPLRDLTWDYAAQSGVQSGAEGPGSTIPVDDEPDAERVLRELNGFHVASGEHLKGSHELADDGSTACGARLYCGVFPAPETNLARRRSAPDSASANVTLYPDWAWTWPGNTRILYNRASADPAGRPWSERKRLVSWDAEQQRWEGPDIPNFDSHKPPDYRPAPDATGLAAIAGDAPFFVHFDGKGWLYVPFGLTDGPLPVYYEPLESPVANALLKQQVSPATRIIMDSLNPVAGEGDPRYPHVLTSYRVTEHFLSGVMTRHNSWLTELQPSLFFEIDPDLAEKLGLSTLDWAVAESPRGVMEGRVLVTPRLRPLPLREGWVHVVGVPMHFGYQGEVVGDAVNLLSPMSLGLNSDIASVKSFVCGLRPGRLPARSRRSTMQRDLRAGLPDAPMSSLDWSTSPEGRLDHDA